MYFTKDDRFLVALGTRVNYVWSAMGWCGVPLADRWRRLGVCLASSVMGASTTIVCSVQGSNRARVEKWRFTAATAGMINRTAHL